MNITLFWKLIEHSNTQQIDADLHLENLIVQLSELSNEDILDYEYRLREVLEECNKYSVLAAAKIIEGYVSDDSFLYFRCGLIAHGKDFFYKSLENIDHLVDVNMDILEIGEDYLYISDDAFIKKNGEDVVHPLPRETASSYLDYNTNLSIKGEDWKEEDLPKLYPKLWEKFGVNNPMKDAIEEIITKYFDNRDKH